MTAKGDRRKRRQAEDREREAVVAPRKLAEIWEIEGGYYLRVDVGAFEHRFTAKPALERATYEVVEVLRKIVADVDANKIVDGNRIELRSDEREPGRFLAVAVESTVVAGHLRDEDLSP